MKVEKIKSRNIIFTYNIPDGWDLNLHLIMGSRYNYVVDTGLGSLSIAPVLEYIKGSEKPVLVINTHHHWDHIWGNHMFPESLILAHTLCRDRIDEKWEDMLKKSNSFLYGETGKQLPNLTFDSELYFAEDKIRLFYTPGHTKDSISVLDEADKVLNAGDNIGDSMEELIPSLECERAEYIQTLLNYKELDFEYCISGHNVVLDKSVIDKMLKLL
jgi:glyoxylase-like metal-dependent hydrolase (beta-lactamase superfamily II)